MGTKYIDGDQVVIHKTKIIIIIGPTSIGKSQLALDLANEFDTEIISADSMQIYRYMDIGTAKPTPDEQRWVKHHLIDVLYPDEAFSAELFRQRATTAISNVNRQGKIAIVAGGTGLYVKALTGGLFDGPGADPQLRQELKEKAAKEGSQSLYRELTEIDPVTAARLHHNDSFRIIRALEVYQLTQRPLSKHHDKHNFKKSPFETLKICLHLEDRQRLYSRIEHRADRMMAAGLVDEVKSLLTMGYTADLKPMQALGYKQITGYLSGEFSLDESILRLKRDTKRYAKRQMTWFRADPEINWYTYPDDYGEILRKTKGFVKRAPNRNHH